MLSETVELRRVERWRVKQEEQESEEGEQAGAGKEQGGARRNRENQGGVGRCKEVHAHAWRG